MLLNVHETLQTLWLDNRLCPLIYLGITRELIPKAPPPLSHCVAVVCGQWSCWRSVELYVLKRVKGHAKRWIGKLCYRKCESFVQFTVADHLWYLHGKCTSLLGLCFLNCNPCVNGWSWMELQKLWSWSVLSSLVKQIKHYQFRSMSNIDRDRRVLHVLLWGNIHLTAQIRLATVGVNFLRNMRT